MKKFVSLLLAGLTAVSMAACSSGGGSTPAPDAGNTPKETAEAAPEDDYENIR